MINNKILALKYRPQEFKDLIGQEVMTQTITNAIKLGKTPNAYLLTGIRGVGKTTTARLIAKALNCLKNNNNEIECKSEKFCSSCLEISNSNHIDILEMDAASKTGIDDVRELIENSKYSPTSAKFKIFIIDEVHMLSKQAFNGLLKTLEEPPASLKFILATTEVRKIPVTILSRCQRFDLKRVSLDKLFKHLKDISIKEKGRITEKALQLIAHNSEGSVRDGISLLDRALISSTINPSKEVDDNEVREMLGLADRSKIISLFKEILAGNEKKAILDLKELINLGLDSKLFLNDMLEIFYLFSRRINLGPIEKDMTISESEIKMINEYANNIDMQDIGLFWQLTIKTLDDLKIINNENLTLEMYLMQLIHLKDIKEINQSGIQIDEEKSNTENEKVISKNDDQIFKTLVSKTKSQLKNTDQIKKNILENSKKTIDEEKIQIKSFQDLIKQADKDKEVELKYDLERNVKLVKFDTGKIDISFNEKLNKNFIKILTEKLLLWTGERWVISLSQVNGEKTIFEKQQEQKSFQLVDAKKSDVAKELFSAFPDAKISKIVEDKDD